ncbi:protoporphyrinogen oxidase [Spirulina subsalsa FACHB-351]|uniref:Coproporphyrinogen III oxidase n=1 Tax=Spirulina subsalsa FACHB-351 TaxID=234711 RepID=A0ABT3LA04_9CYAN|nr:protoporphyrinogen oxidase [Spirulina subsalsa]MCW6038328.1 protoporphyrinogen oxidase [Spirulina subsalsa FACHB-351]
MLDSLIVGAGISGLSAAHTLQKQQTQFLVTESQGRVGGNITTNRQGEYLWEEGPNSFAPTEDLLRLAVDVGLKDDLVFADRRLPRFVYWNQQLNPVPMSPPAALKTQLLSERGKWRAALGALGFVGGLVGQEEETVRQFFTRHLGTEVTERLVAPFVSGVYAGDVDQLSAQAAFRRVFEFAQLGGGLLAGGILARRQAPPKAPRDPSLPETKTGQLGSFREGLEMLPRAIASQLGDRLKLHWQLTQIEITPQQTYLAHFNTPDGPQQIATRTLILTTPAPITADLLKPLTSPLSRVLKEIYYPPVACVVLAYPKAASVHPLKGFGHLIPRQQGIRTLGTIWSSCLFPGRTPEGEYMLTNFIGGATDPGIAQLSPEEIAQAVHQDLSKIFIRPEFSPKILAVRLWKQAIPQYTLGHLQRLATLEQELKKFPGLHILANYTDGVALGDCIRRGIAVAQNIQ